jgi:hypothetical protein
MMNPVALALFVFVLVTVGCDAPETETSAARGRGVDAVDIEEIEGERSAGGPLELPDGFPSDFPLPPDFDIYESRFVEGDFATRANYFIRGKTSSDLGELVTFYRERIPEAGFKLIHQPPDAAAEGNAMFYFQNETYSDCSVQLQQEEDVTDVLINLPLRDEGVG